MMHSNCRFRDADYFAIKLVSGKSLLRSPVKISVSQHMHRENNRTKCIGGETLFPNVIAIVVKRIDKLSASEIYHVARANR